MKPFHIMLLILSIMLLSFIGFANRDKLIVKNVVIKSDLNINRKDFAKKMGLKNNRYIWEYNLIALGKKLDKLYYIDEYKLSFSYPLVLTIELRIRKPLARITGKDDDVYFIDKKGIVYKSGRIKPNVPLLILDERSSISVGKRLKGKYSDVIDVLYIVSKKYERLYQAISQINVDFSHSQPVYTINFRTINKTITLKKYLNVENIVNSLAVSKITDEIDNVPDNIYGLDNGFFYKLYGEE